MLSAGCAPQPKTGPASIKSADWQYSIICCKVYSSSFFMCPTFTCSHIARTRTRIPIYPVRSLMCGSVVCACVGMLNISLRYQVLCVRCKVSGFGFTVLTFRVYGMVYPIWVKVHVCRSCVLCMFVASLNWPGTWPEWASAIRHTLLVCFEAPLFPGEEPLREV